MEPASAESVSIPSSINYLDLGLVTSVKDQGQCGSCWAFAAAGVYESWLLQDGQGATDLSEQYILQCDTGSLGCDGGYPDSTFDLVLDTGVPEESDYQYTATYIRGKRESRNICSDLVSNANPRKIRNYDSDLSYTYYYSSTKRTPD